MRSFSDSDTRCSKFEYACTTYQRSAMSDPTLSGKGLGRPGETEVDEPEKQASHDHEDEHSDRHLQGLLPGRPHDLAKLDAGVEEKLLQAAPVCRHRHYQRR